MSTNNLVRTFYFDTLGFFSFTDLIILGLNTSEIQRVHLIEIYSKYKYESRTFTAIKLISWYKSIF